LKGFKDLCLKYGPSNRQNQALTGLFLSHLLDNGGVSCQVCGRDLADVPDGIEKLKRFLRIVAAQKVFERLERE
jgi:hypothetical protein